MTIETPASLDQIVENGLCTGCGLCRSVFGADVLTHTDEPDGLERPRELRPLTPDETLTLNAICPGLHVSAPKPLGDGLHDPMWGNALMIAQGFAGDPEIRFRAATGGALTALAIHILESGKADYILHLAADPDRPMLSKTRRSYTAEQVVEGSGSRYAATAPLLGVAQALDDGRPFAFVGKPCDVTGIANLARVDPRVDELCRYRLSISCGGFSLLSKFQDLLKDWDIAEEDLVRFSYRGYGCPGPTFGETRDGRRGETSYQDQWADSANWRSFYRCKICPDAIGLSADVVALDVWPGGVPEGEDEGWNGVIARTQAGRALVEDALADGTLVFDAEGDLDWIAGTQPHQSRKRAAVRARYGALAEEGVLHPRTEDAGLDAISFPPDSEAYAREQAGTRMRLARGDHLRD